MLERVKSNKAHPVLDHVLDLSLHGEDEQDDEVDEQNGPEDGHVEHAEEGHQKPHHHCLTTRVPASPNHAQTQE